MNKKFALVCFGNEESYGLLFVGGELRDRRQAFRFFDAEAPGVARAVIDWQPDFVCFSPMTTFFPAALEACREIKRARPSAVSVFGGHHASALPSIVEHDEIDAVVVGPSRGAIGQILDGVRGVIRTPLTTPADLPAPAREQYFRDIPRMARRYRKVMLSRLGCPWNCSYCSSAAGRLRDQYGGAAHARYYMGRRPLAALLDEAREIARYPTDEIEWVDDDMFAGADADSWIPEFAAAWKDAIGLPLYVSTTSRNALRVSDRALAALKPLVNVVGMGVQAVRPESLKLFNRAWDSEPLMKAAYDRLVAFGYAVNLQCIVGLPVADPVEDALDTVRALQRIGPGSVCSCYPLMIYPGTALEAYCRDHGLQLNESCGGDTNSGIPGIRFDERTTRRLRNICKLATLFVKHNIGDQWMRALLDVDFDDETSRRLSTARYYECVTDRLKDRGREVFAEIMRTTNLRY